MRQIISNHRAFLFLLFCYIVVTTLFAFRLPALAGPNEGLHYEYIALMLRNGRLPDLSTSQRADERHQPPVYYTTAALLSLPFGEPLLDTEFDRNPYFTTTAWGNLNPIVHATTSNASALYASRLASMLFGVLALVSIYFGARLTLSLPISLLIVSMTAFQPTFLYLSVTVNNDLAVTALGAVLIAYTTYLIIKDKEPRFFLLWGLFFAFAMLTKASAIFLFILLPIICWTIWRSEQQWRRAILSGLWGLIGFLPFWLIWMGFNQIRSDDALGLAPSIPLARLLTLTPSDVTLLTPYAGELFRSFWMDWSPGILGYAPLWVYLFWGLFLFIAWAGWLKRNNRVSQPITVVRLHLFLVVALGVAFLAVKTLMIREAGFLVPEGRWLLPIWPSLAWLAGVGWAKWWSPARQIRACRIATTIPLLFALGLFLLVFPNLYPKAQRLALASQLPSESESVNLIYDQQVELLAAEAAPFVVGQPAQVMLYWQALQPIATDYTISAQLLYFQGGEWVKLAEQNSFPGNGLSPTGDWQADGIYRDVLVLQPEGELNGPTAASLLVSLAKDGGSVAIEGNGEATNWPIAHEIVVRPSPLGQLVLRNNTLDSSVNFGDLFDLTGLSYAFEDGEFVVTLGWEALADVAQDFTVFIHILDEDGQLVAQSDAMPVNGASPTRLWQVGDVIRDVHRFEGALPADLILVVGVYDSASLAHLVATQDGQLLADNVWRYVVP